MRNRYSPAPLPRWPTEQKKKQTKNHRKEKKIDEEEEEEKKRGDHVSPNEEGRAKGIDGLVVRLPIKKKDNMKEEGVATLGRRHGR